MDRLPWMKSYFQCITFFNNVKNRPRNTNSICVNKRSCFVKRRHSVELAYKRVYIIRKECSIYFLILAPHYIASDSAAAGSAYKGLGSHLASDVGYLEPTAHQKRVESSSLIFHWRLVFILSSNFHRDFGESLTFLLLIVYSFIIIFNFELIVIFFKLDRIQV